MSLKDHLQKKKEAYSDELKKLCKALDNMPEVTFRYKLRKKTFSGLELQKISEITNIPVEDLLPVPSKKVS